MMRSRACNFRFGSSMTAALNSLRLAFGNSASRAYPRAAWRGQEAAADPGTGCSGLLSHSALAGETGAVPSSGIERWGQKWSCLLSPLSSRGGPVPEHLEMSTGGNSTSLTRPISWIRFLVDFPPFTIHSRFINDGEWPCPRNRSPT
jgi:hypothetical protein